MGRTDNDSTKKIYLNIVSGKIAERVTAETPNAIKRYSEKKQADVYEILNDNLTGTIAEMKIDSGDYGKQLLITIKDMGEKYILTLPVESKFFDSFCSKIMGVDLSKEIKITPYSFMPKDSDKKKTGINIYQNDEKLPYHFTKENPQGKPFPEAENLGEDDWKIFKIKERKFFCEMIEKINSGAVKQTENNSNNNQTDDMPF